MKSCFTNCLVATALVAGAGTVSADEVEAPLRALYQEKIAAWANATSVVEAIKAQNGAHRDLAQAEIDSLDKDWRAQTKGGAAPLVERVLGNGLSGYLKQVKQEGAGLYTEIFVMDNRGLNVGQSDVTSDYWQGDEAKWKQTYAKGAGAIHVGEVELDDSTQTYQSQISAAIVDPTNGEVIGAITVGVDVDAAIN